MGIDNSLPSGDTRRLLVCPLLNAKKKHCKTKQIELLSLKNRIQILALKKQFRFLDIFQTTHTCALKRFTS